MRWLARRVAVVVAFGWTVASAAVSYNGLTLYLPFADSALDESGNGHHGSLVGGSGAAADRFGDQDISLEPLVCLQGAIGRYLRGEVDEFVLYGRALSNAEVAGLHHDGEVEPTDPIDLNGRIMSHGRRRGLRAGSLLVTRSSWYIQAVQSKTGRSACES